LEDAQIRKVCIALPRRLSGDTRKEADPLSMNEQSWNLKAG